MHKKVKWNAFLKLHRKPENASSPEMLRMPRRGHHALRYSSFKQPWCPAFAESLQGSTTACCLCQPTQWLHNVDILFMRPFPFWEEADKILFFSRPLVTDCACMCVGGCVCVRVRQIASKYITDGFEKTDMIWSLMSAPVCFLFFSPRNSVIFHWFANWQHENI